MPLCGHPGTWILQVPPPLCPRLIPVMVDSLAVLGLPGPGPEAVLPGGVSAASWPPAPPHPLQALGALLTEQGWRGVPAAGTGHPGAVSH